MDTGASKGAAAIILASGVGARFRSEIPKQFLKLAGKTVLEHTLDVFQRHVDVAEIIVVVAAEQRLVVEEIVVRGGYGKVSAIVNGGVTRQQSSAAGIAAIRADDIKVLVHDAVRPLLDPSTISRCLQALDEFDAVDTGIPSPDTIIQVDEHDCIRDIPDRSHLRLGQTPQAFRAGLLRQAHHLARDDAAIRVTDDCGLVLHYGLAEIHVVDGDVSNVKITYPSDVYLADRLFQLRSRKILESAPLPDIAGKVIVVFGASRGIGARIVEMAGAAGADVVGYSRAEGVDVTDASSVKAALVQAMERYGRIDAVVNTAGVLRTGVLDGLDYASIDEQILINLRGSVVVAKEAFCAMRRGGGSIALFTSSSYTRGRARSALYSATKAAIVNLMQGLAEEYQPFGVRIIAINPERTATPMRQENFGSEPESELLSPGAVAGATLRSLFSAATGEVIDVRR